MTLTAIEAFDGSEVKHACLERYLFYMIDPSKGDYVFESIRFIYCFRVAFGALFTGYTIFLISQ